MATSPQLQGKDFLRQKKTILTEDDVLHYRRLSCGGSAETPSDSGEDDAEFVVFDVVLTNDHFTKNEKSESDLSFNKTRTETILKEEYTHGNVDEWIYFPTGLTVESIQTNTDSRRGEGVPATINGHELAVFYSQSERAVYTTDQKCPHAGGPLYEGEIEDITGTGQPCVICPWHKFCFDLKTGRTTRPLHRDELLTVYPTRIEEDGQISIGFKSFHNSCFSDENF